MPSLIQQGGENSPSVLITRSMRLVGRFPTFIDEMMAGTVQVADLSEAGPLPIIGRACSLAEQGAVALERCVFRLEVPVGIVAKVRRVYCRIGTVNRTHLDVFFGTSIVAPPNLAPKAFTDGRLRARGRTPGGNLAFGTQVAAIAVEHQRLPMIDDEGSYHVVDWTFGRTDAVDFIELVSPMLDVGVVVGMEWDETEG